MFHYMPTPGRGHGTQGFFPRLSKLIVNSLRRVAYCPERGRSMACAVGELFHELANNRFRIAE
jgi:hypothetical protein